MVFAHGPEDPDSSVPGSRANQAAAFERTSRSWRSCRTSRHSRASSSASARRALLHPAAHLRAGDRDPVADRLCSEPELPGKIIRITAGTNQVKHLAGELRSIASTCLGHGIRLLRKRRGVDESGSPPTPCSPDPAANGHPRHFADGRLPGKRKERGGAPRRARRPAHGRLQPGQLSAGAHDPARSGRAAARQPVRDRGGLAPLRIRAGAGRVDWAALELQPHPRPGRQPELRQGDGGRSFHGIVNSFSGTGKGHAFAHYRARVSPRM